MSFWNADLLHLMNEALVPWRCSGHRSRKPVFAYLVLQLMDQGKLRLDTTLGNCLPDYIPGDPRAASITIDHALSHSAGLPNWRNLELPLRNTLPAGREVQLLRRRLSLRSEGD
jgi:CubicO group peptidase (beta-lactamase class C family)